jgi:hypothetical protein
MIRSPRGGRGGERGTVDKNNRYRLLQGLGDTGSPDRVVTRGMSRGRDERVDGMAGRTRDVGEKRTLDERSPGDHGMGERNSRARVMSGDRRSSNRWEEDEEEMGEDGEEEDTHRD